MKTFNISFRRSLLWLVALTALPIKAMAAPAQLSIEPFTIQAGESKEMTIYLTNPDDEITLVQFDLRLPEGLNISQTGGELDIDIAGRTTWRKHSLDANQLESRLYRFLLASSSNAVLDGADGAVIKVTLMAGDNFTGGTVRLENILLVTPDEKETHQGTYELELSGTPDIQLNEGFYYVQNVASGNYINCGGNWGTHIIADKLGFELLLTRAEDGKHWKLISCIRSNIGGDGALGTEGYVDNYEGTDLMLASIGDDVYAILADNGKYLTTNAVDNLVDFNGMSPDDSKAQWRFIDAEEVFMGRLKALETASAENPIDATFLIPCPNVNNAKDNRMTSWNMDSGTAYYNYGISVIDAEPILEFFRSVDNGSNAPFSFLQDVTLLPGRYKLQAQGFYRDGDYAEAAHRHSDGNEQIDAFLTAGDASTPLKSIFEQISSSQKRGWSTWTSLGYIPNTMAEASYTFQAGAYDNELFFDVSEEDAKNPVCFGIRGRESFHYNNWTTIDNFRLTYYGAVPPEPEVTASLSIEPFTIQPGESKEMTIDLTNPDDEITLVQFDLQLSEGLSIKQTGGEYDIDIAGRTTWRRHSLDANEVGTRRYRFLLSSSSNTVLSGTEGAIIKVTLTAANSFTEGTAKFEDILLVTPDEKELKPKNFSIPISKGDGINATKVDGKPVSVYDYTGRRLAAPQRGVNLLRMSDGTVRKVVNSLR